MTTSNISNYENSEIKKKIDNLSCSYNVKKIIKILLTIDELYFEAINLEYDIKTDINKYGEEVVLQTVENRNKIQNVCKMESQVKSIIKSNRYQLENLIQFLSNLINKKEGES